MGSDCISSCSLFTSLLAVMNTPPFMMDTDNMAHFFCMNGKQQYRTERTQCLCRRRLKISSRFLITFLFLGLNFA